MMIFGVAIFMILFNNDTFNVLQLVDTECTDVYWNTHTYSFLQVTKPKLFGRTSFFLSTSSSISNTLKFQKSTKKI